MWFDQIALSAENNIVSSRVRIVRNFDNYLFLFIFINRSLSIKSSNNYQCHYICSYQKQHILFF